MPSTTSSIGPLVLPVPAGEANARIADPVIDGLLDFYAFFIKANLDDKLATLTRTSADAVPVDNRYAFDPTSPRAPRVEIKIPALFMWWEGTSTMVPYTTVYSLRRRELGIMYVFNELSTTAQLGTCDGLLAAVDGAIRMATDRKRHPLYGYNGDAVGTSIRRSLGGLDVFQFECSRTTVGRFGLDASSSSGRASKRSAGNADSGRDYPTLLGQIVVHERINLDTQLDPDDVFGDIYVTIDTDEAGDENNVTEYLTGIVPGPDGSELE